MVLVRGLSLDEVIRRSSQIDVVIAREMRAVARQAASQLGQVTVAASVRQAVSPGDVNQIRTLWRDLVDKSLMAHVLDAFLAASRAVSIDFNRILSKVLRDHPQWRPPDTRGTDGRRQLPPQRAGQRIYQPPPPSPSETDGNVDIDFDEDSDDLYLDPLDEDQVAEVLLATARNRLVDIGDDLWESARDELVTGLNEGESIDKLAARVRGAADLAAPRARSIARTEVIGACNAGSITTMRLNELGTAKVWLATPDTRTRIDHLQAQGQSVPLDEPFIVGGVPLDHPGDPAGPPEQCINCRCTLLYDVEELPTPEGEDDADSVGGFDPSMFPDIDFTTLGLETLHLPGKHNQADHRNKKKKKSGSDSDSGGSGGSKSDSDSGGGGGDSRKQSDDQSDKPDKPEKPEKKRGVEPRHPPAEPLTGSGYRRLLDRYEGDYDMVGVDVSRARDALDSYVGNDYADINGGMRRDNVDSQSQETIDTLNDVFNSGVLTTEPFVTYRGLGNTPWTFGKTPEPGDVFTDRAFGSTTADRKTADTFLDGAGGTTGMSLERIAEFDPSALDNAAILSINVPRGSRVLPVDSIRGAGYGSGFSRESEILLPANTSLRVVSVDDPDPDTMTPRVVHMEVVTDG